MEDLWFLASLFFSIFFFFYSIWQMIRRIACKGIALLSFPLAFAKEEQKKK